MKQKTREKQTIDELFDNLEYHHEVWGHPSTPKSVDTYYRQPQFHVPIDPDETFHLGGVVTTTDGVSWRKLGVFEDTDAPKAIVTKMSLDNGYITVMSL